MVQIANRKLRQLFLPCLLSKTIQPSGVFFVQMVQASKQYLLDVA